MSIIRKYSSNELEIFIGSRAYKEEFFYDYINYFNELIQFIERSDPRKLPEYQALALDIHQHPEVSNYEFYSSAALIRQLEKEGFTVEKEVAGHRTGFAASYRSD